MDSMIKVGVFFGGSSREREVSFAGGRTVYDNLDKNLFEAVPIFVDPFGNFAKLKWEYIYRGSIRDFYPPVAHLPDSPNQFQIYSESLNPDKTLQLRMLSEVGEVISPEKLAEHIDFAFLALHGEHGEDGTIQGLLEWYGIPYSGSGIFASSLGMNKALQKRLMLQAGFDGPEYVRIERNKWLEQPEQCVRLVEETVGYPMVVKSANQGSSIGISVIRERMEGSLTVAMDKAFFRTKLTKIQWENTDKVQWIRELSDIRSDIGFPLLINDELVYHPEEAMTSLNKKLLNTEEVVVTAVKPEIEVVVERFIEGREFSCIVIRNEDGAPLALPPTEIVKSNHFFDYKSKYLPGLSRKVTPMNLPEVELQRLRVACKKLYEHFGFQVYARIDGFYSSKGEIFLNDPNTTSGMMPSSFFFHQASEIGLNPSQFLSFVIRTSLAERCHHPILSHKSEALIHQLNSAIKSSKKSAGNKIRAGVLMGGYSTERHISVESGRNIYEKLASSAKYEPIPLFLTGNAQQHKLFMLPVNVMLKDNADDIKAKVEHFHQPEILTRIIAEFKELTDTYTTVAPIFEPRAVTYESLQELCDVVFIALHGRPGEDGEVQKRLNQLNIPYNGSGQESSSLTIDKFETNKLLRAHGFMVADNYLVTKEAWLADQNAVIAEIEQLGFPLIAKPSDEGCSSAVKKLKTIQDIKNYALGTFRKEEELSSEMRKLLMLDDKEEFPFKPYFLIENYIDRAGADHFLEITGGLLTRYQDGQLVYEVFEPSEALAEGEVLSLAEKFLAGEGQNITPARFSKDPAINQRISEIIRHKFEQVARVLNVEGYCRIDAFVRIFEPDTVEVIIIEINSLPGMTPATCIYHQAAINGYKPFEFIDKILTFGRERAKAHTN